MVLHDNNEYQSSYEADAEASKAPGARIRAHHVLARSLSNPDDSLDGPAQVTSSDKDATSAGGSGAVLDPTGFNVSTVLDMAAVTWQTRRAPTASRHENRYTSGTSIQYLNQSFVDKIFSGVLKVTVLSVSNSEEPLEKSAGIRVTFKDRHAIAGHPTEPDERECAYLWLHKSEEAAATTSLTFEHVEADTREELSEIHETKTISQATLDIQGQIPTTPAHPYEIVLKSNSTFGNEQDDVSLQVLVSFVPLKIATPLGRLEDPEASLEADMLRISIDLGAQMYSLDDPEDITLGNLAEFDDRSPKDSLYKCAFTLGLLFDSGFWRHGRGAEPMAYIENKATKTELLIFWNEDLKQIAVGFDSTRTSELKDIITNIQLYPAIFDEAGPHDQERFRHWLRVFRGSLTQNHQLVHLGFLRAWRSVQQATDSLIRQAVGAEDNERFKNCDWKTIFTGHSLGGALATLATASAVANGREQDQVALYTFGCPHVGNRKFSETFRQKVPESWRIFNKNDAVSYMPRSTGFSATAPAMCLMPEKNKDGKPVIKLSFPEGTRTVTVVPGQQLSAEMEREYVRPYQNINNLWDRATFEAKRLVNIVSGHGFKMHDTDQYVSNLLTVAQVLGHSVESLSSEELSALDEKIAEAKRLLDNFLNPPELE